MSTDPAGAVSEVKRYRTDILGDPPVGIAPRTWIVLASEHDAAIAALRQQLAELQRERDRLLPFEVAYAEHEQQLAEMRGQLSTARDIIDGIVSGNVPNDQVLLEALGYMEATLSSTERKEADKPRDVLLDQSLRERAHQLRREACSAWSDVVIPPYAGLDQAKCELASKLEDRLRHVIDELADLSRHATPPAQTPQTQGKCERCDGTGNVVIDYCDKCNGTGVTVK
ncbi:MAG TPA: zinc finger-like domain-containing protein [Acidobacteriaceae bacterium]|nr:zinc finger-like domain-containing protein [Acidobacteriaceae bacterium]